MDLFQKQIDKVALKRVEDLREDVLPKHIEKNNLFNYEVEWLAVSGHDMEAWDNYIMAFVIDFYKVET